MKLLVSCLGYDSGKSGISNYMMNVLAELKLVEEDITVVLENDAVNDFSNFKKILVPKIFSKSLAGYLWSIFILPFIARKFDCVLVLAGNRRFVPFGKTSTVGVIHDLSQYRVANKYGWLRMFQLFKVQPILAKKFSKLVAISKTTRTDIAKYWKLDENSIELNYNGTSKLPAPDNAILERLNLQKYILYVSRIEHPAKNHANLIKAFEALPEDIRKNHKLVFVGADWDNADVVRKLATESISAENIVFSGFVSNAELSSLYKNASVFVFPSFAEGFGLGLVEAMSNGVVCACSNVSALAEVGGDTVLQFNPSEVSEISNSIKTLIENEQLRTELIAKAKERSSIFSWQTHAKTLSDICRKEFQKISKLKIFDVEFFNGRFADIIEIFTDRILQNKKTSVAFINTHYLNCAYESTEQRKRLNSFDFVLPDGSGVRLACKIMRYKFCDNLNGTDLLPYLCKLASEKNLTMYFLGGRENVAARAAENLKMKYPNLKIVGTRSGYFEDHNAVVAEVNIQKPDILFVGFGAVIQEKWLLENLDKLDCKLALAVGGLVDVYSGNLKRNPILRKLGLEWFGRLLQEPCRLFGRYVIGNPLFVFRVLLYKFFGKSGK
ncbi:MAG: WecB/TagA/CpsF family glycosyltransferase [Verrucomicrobiaceae bacterium]|nr:WecB/TagA/CpsF family glycosyltransferase [Verrucomicrobiaceae bacterium]